MMEKERTYVAIDLKSFYASVECKERNRDPLTTNLVVADKSRTEKTICLAVSPALKCYGIPGRARLFEVVQKVKEANSARRWKAPNRTFIGSSDDSAELNSNPALEIDYIVAPPRMALYLEYSTRIYSIYLKYIAPEDIFPYSIDEVFMDVTDYLHTYNMTARELAMTMIQDVLKTTGITATAGIGRELLTEEGCIVETADDGVACIDMIEKAEADYYKMILMDIQMPVMNGYDAALAIRKMKDTKKSRIPIIAMTANVFAEDIQKVLSVGMNDHVAKPVDMNILVPTMMKYL